MNLLIVRHAIAFERDAKRWPDDRARPLRPEGISRARRAAAGLKHWADRPQLLLTSPLTRAKQTAEILTQNAEWPRAVECPALAPGEPPESALDALRGHGGSEVIAVVGHQPGLGELIAACLPGSAQAQAFELRKFGVALLSFEGVPRSGTATLRWLLAPKLLRALR